MNTINWKNNKLSKLCLGTVQFGLDYGISNKRGKVSQKEVDAILDFVFSQRINILDTAQAYGDSEKVIGNFLKTHPNNINVVSKISSETLNNNSFKEIIKETLDRLNIDTLFSLLLHDSLVLYNWNSKISNKIKELKEKGYIKYFGVSIYTDEEFTIAMENELIDVVQIPYNLFDHRAISKEWFSRAKEKDKLILIRSIYLQGLVLMDKNDLPQSLNDAKKYMDIIENICKQQNITKNQLSITFVNQTAKDAILLFGCEDLMQAKENVKNFTTPIKLDNEIISYLKERLSDVPEKIYNPTKWIQK